MYILGTISVPMVQNWDDHVTLGINPQKIGATNTNHHMGLGWPLAFGIWYLVFGISALGYETLFAIRIRSAVYKIHLVNFKFSS